MITRDKQPNLLRRNDINTKNHTGYADVDFAELLEEYESVRLHRGEIVQGEILAVSEDTVLLDVGAKRDAIVPTRELAQLDDVITEDISVGDQLPVYVTHTSDYNNELLVSIEKGLEKRDWERAQEYLESGESLQLKVVSYNIGGLLVGFGRIRGFIPNSKISGLRRGLSKNERRSAKSKMIGETLNAKVIEANPVRKRLILSEKAAEGSRRKERIQELEVGQKITGYVSNVVDFGVFVNLNEVDGLIHVSRLSWDKVDHPSDVLKPGDEVEVLIKDVDVERERISLDRKSLLPNPWEIFAEQYHHGDIMEGEVESVRDYGAFVKLTDKITGLIHTSEMLEGSSHSPTESLDVGDKVLVRIIEIDTEQERVRLSMRRVPQDDIAQWIIDSEDNFTQENVGDSESEG